MGTGASVPVDNLTAEEKAEIVNVMRVDSINNIL